MPVYLFYNPYILAVLVKYERSLTKFPKHTISWADHMFARCFFNDHFPRLASFFGGLSLDNT